MNFNQALKSALTIVLRKFEGSSEDILLVRDLYGKIRVMLSGDALQNCGDLAEKLVEALGPYSYDADSACLAASDFPGIERQAHQTLHDDGRLRVRLLDRLLLGTQWNAPPVSRTTGPKRFTLFSMKGGVGRSTTAAVLAWHLARKGKNVLVVDLDLESPGVGTTLLPPKRLPDYGIVDWFVEDALGQADTVEEAMVAPSPLSSKGEGRVLVAPAFGSDTGDYLPKLGRSYLERGRSEPEAWPSRLRRLLQKLEEQVRPDIVLLDSRMGLHDTSATLILAVGAETLLFAIDTRQTWTAYRFLFDHWQDHPSIRAFREKLWIVASMVPETNPDAYLSGFRDSAWDLFSSLYDSEATADEGFSYSLENEAAPHAPALRHIFWNRSLQSFDPISKLEVHAIESAYGLFLRWFDRTLLGDGDELVT